MVDYSNHLISMKHYIILGAFIALFFSSQITAQERQDNAWKAVFTDYSLSNSSTIRLETHVRTRDFFATNDQYLIRPSISRKVGNTLLLQADIPSFQPIHLCIVPSKITFGSNSIFLSL